MEYTNKGCKVEEHPFGYRSVHYLIVTKPLKMELVAEIQVRTIFEEGWSEIDHQLRYPYDTDNTVLSQYLLIFNRLAGSADEMGSFTRFLAEWLLKSSADHDQQMTALRSEIQSLQIAVGDKDKLQKKLDEILRPQSNVPHLSMSDALMASIRKGPPINQSFIEALAKMPPPNPSIVEAIAKMPRPDPSLAKAIGAFNKKR